MSFLAQQEEVRVSLCYTLAQGLGSEPGLTLNVKGPKESLTVACRGFTWILLDLKTSISNLKGAWSQIWSNSNFFVLIIHNALGVHF